ncbi:hypothetical protein [Anaerovorax sp. IOR16]|uniref:hypothetical protein n=1 Tax=Anaerovorax sp. IOR16 TaxID=2773458 RepID=UPI0019D18F92|nr:hypothetical protein [Anaerovorax sp. IOR16]
MEHLCPKCNAELQIANNQLKSERDSEDVYCELTMVCPNPNCENYAGPDRNNPKTVVKTIRNKVN